MFPTIKVNVLKTTSLFVFFCGHFLPKHKKKCLIHQKMLHHTPSIMKTIRPSKVALLGPKGGLCGEIQRNQIFLIVIFSFNLIQIPVQFALKIWGKSQ